MALNNTWGKFKKNFYGRNKADDDVSDTSDDQDELEDIPKDHWWYRLRPKK